MNLESRIRKLEELSPEQYNPLIFMSDEEIEEKVRGIIARSTGYDGLLTTKAMINISKILLKCHGILDELAPEDQMDLNRLLGG